jgi:Rrf2 family transcriptional regulator, nitric oxide-sensitive transcriptional repressor
MKLTTFTDYSLRVLIYLAAEPQRRATIAEIAAAFRISEHHLTKVAHFLGRGGWLANVRGHGGGLEPARPAAQIGIGQLVRETEGQDLPASCFGEAERCTIAPVCRLRGVFGAAVEAFYGVLDNCTLADLVQNQAALAPLLFVERATPARVPA